MSFLALRSTFTPSDSAILCIASALRFLPEKKSKRLRGGDYFGPPLNRVARLLSAAHGGQVLLSAAYQEMVRDQLPAGSALMDQGERRLKDLFRPERVFQPTWQRCSPGE
jgi:hypothetical protein